MKTLKTKPSVRLASRTAVCAFLLAGSLPPCFAAATGKPDKLTTDSLTNPLGLDTKQPALSWQLDDTRSGARQTAYELEVASKPALLTSDKPDVWDSGKAHSDTSVHVAYGGPALHAETRYYWRVKVWDKDGKAYPVSDVNWWETGLMSPEAWRAKWIGYEEEEHRRVRESGAAWITIASDPNVKVGGDTRHDFRFPFTLDKPVRRAELFVTGKDTAAAWVNGKQVLETQPLPPWRQAPWKTHVSRDVTAEINQGKNLLAVEVLLYGPPSSNGDPAVEDKRTPMSACLYVEMADGSSTVFASSTHWKASLNARQNWQQPQFDDAAWGDAIPYVSAGSQKGTTEVGNPWPTAPVKLLRRTFEINRPIVSARLYATALGTYQFHINGERVGDQILAPGWTDYRHRVFYQVYDVTRDIRPGQNAIAAYLAPGWYTTPLMWFHQGYNYGDTPPALKAQLRLEHADGSVEWLTTDEAWKASVSPVLKAEIYDGETYDARQNQAGWDSPGFSDGAWKAAELIKPTEPEILAQNFQPIRVEKTFAAKTITNPKPGIYIYDFGQNLAGVARLHVEGRAGTDVQLRFAEVLNPDGTLYVENLRTAKATDHYILSGKGVEEFQPDFTFHGFRYVEVSGLKTKPDLALLEAVVFHTDAPWTAELHTGNSMINQLWSNILWGQRSNFIGVPTDCPQRDERLGWTADAQVFWRTASYNMDLTEFSKKFSGDVRGTQVGTPMYGIFAPGTDTSNPGFGAGWSDAGIIIPWTAWLHSGDTRVIEQNWDGMTRYLSAIQSANPDYLWKKESGIPFGDWLSPEGPTREDLIATAYWAYDVTLMQQMAHALGKVDEEKKYAELFSQIKTAFNQAFVRPDGFVNGAAHRPPGADPNGNFDTQAKEGDTQTGYVLALNMNLLPASLRQAAGEKLVGKIEANHGRLGTGFLGTPYLLAALVDTGHSDVAYRLLLNTEYPSWGYLVDHGATTMWERWNGDQMRGDPTMNSYNHYAYGAVADWIYRFAAGIDALPSDAGFHTIYLHPTFDASLGNLDFSYESPYGKIQSGWSAQGAEVTWRLTIPANAKGRLPLTAPEADRFTLDGIKLAKSPRAHLTTSTDSRDVYELPAGSYSFKISGQ